MARAEVNWTDETSVLGHAIYWSHQIDWDLIVYHTHDASGSFSIASLTQREKIEEKGFTVKWVLTQKPR